MQPSTVLVAEDNPVNQLVARKLLEGLGLTVTIASTGVEAVARASEHRYALILMDLQMPLMDGIEATKKILSMCQHKPVIIACTAHVSPEHRAECRAAGMDDFLPKPVRKEALEEMVARWLEVALEREHAQEARGLHGRLAQLVAETDEAFVREIAGVFVTSGVDLVKAAADEWHSGNRQAAIRAIHSLKGASGNLGAEEMMAACAAWEQKGKDGTLEESDLLQLAHMFDETVRALEHALGSAAKV